MHQISFHSTINGYTLSIGKFTTLIMKAFKGWVTGSGVALSTVEINKLLLKKYCTIVEKILTFFATSGIFKLSIKPSLFHVSLLLELLALKAN